MKFVKGILIGSIVATSMMVMYNEGMMNKNKVMNKGRKFAKKMGIL